jgi:hypothetical protein
MAQEALGCLDFCQELVYVPTGVDLGVVGAISHPEVTWLSAMAKVGEGHKPSQFPKLSDSV